MMLVEADAVIAQPVELLPRVEMLGVGPHRHLGLEVLLAQRIGQLGVPALEMIEILAIGEEIENEDFHGGESSGAGGAARVFRLPGGADPLPMRGARLTIAATNRR